MPCLFQFSSVPPWLCGEFPRVLSIHNLLQICVNSRNSRQSFCFPPLTDSLRLCGSSLSASQPLSFSVFLCASVALW